MRERLEGYVFGDILDREAAEHEAPPFAVNLREHRGRRYNVVETFLHDHNPFR